jgi:two-component system, NarL family, response regulator DesR
MRSVVIHRCVSGTVRNYLAAVITKLGVASRAKAIRTAHDNGWL